MKTDDPTSTLTAIQQQLFRHSFAYNPASASGVALEQSANGGMPTAQGGMLGASPVSAQGLMAAAVGSLWGDVNSFQQQPMSQPPGGNLMVDAGDDGGGAGSEGM